MNQDSTSQISLSISASTLNKSNESCWVCETDVTSDLGSWQTLEDRVYHRFFLLADGRPPIHRRFVRVSGL